MANDTLARVLAIATASDISTISSKTSALPDWYEYYLYTFHLADFDKTYGTITDFDTATHLTGSGLTQQAGMLMNNLALTSWNKSSIEGDIPKVITLIQILNDEGLLSIPNTLQYRIGDIKHTYTVSVQLTNNELSMLFTDSAIGTLNAIWNRNTQKFTVFNSLYDHLPYADEGLNIYDEQKDIIKSNLSFINHRNYEEYQDLSELNLSLVDNTEYDISGCTGIVITYPQDKFESILHINFNTNVDISFPTGTKYIGGEPQFEPDSSWEISIKDKVVIAGKIE